MNSKNGEEIIKKLIKEMDAPISGVANLNETDIRKKIKSVDRGEVIRKLNSMGLGKAAQMLNGMSDEEIIRKIAANPSILKKIDMFLKGDK